MRADVIDARVRRLHWLALISLTLAAIGSCRPVDAADPHAIELHRQALTRLHRGNTGEAADSFAAALLIGNPTPVLLYNAAYAAYRRGDAADARQLAERALEQAPDDPLALALIGLLDLEAGRLAQAEASLRGLLARHPDHALATAYFGHCLALKGELAAARGHLERALAMIAARAQAAHVDPALTAPPPDPGAEAAEPQALASLGYVLLRTEDYPGAVLACKRALKIDPSLVSARSHLGLAYFSLGQCREAADAFAQVLRARPDDQRARYHLGLSLVKQGHLDQGLEELKRVIAAGKPEELVRLCRELLDGGTLTEN